MRNLGKNIQQMEKMLSHAFDHTDLIERLFLNDSQMMAVLP
jgi:hypothetical protein